MSGLVNCSAFRAARGEIEPAQAGFVAASRLRDVYDGLRLEPQVSM